MPPYVWVLFVAVLLVLLILLAIGIYDLVKPADGVALKPDLGTQTQDTQLGSANEIFQNFYRGGEGTLSIFMYLHPMNRPATLEQPTELENRFRGAENDPRLSQTPYSVDQSPNSSVSPITLFYIGISSQPLLTFKQVPTGASRKEYVELEIRTANGDSGATERFTVPPLPRQKWVCITITRQGRRYKIYYDTQLVSTFRTINYPVDNQDATTLHTGRSILSRTATGVAMASSGYFAWPYVSSRELTVEDIAKRIDDRANTRTKPDVPQPRFTNILQSLSGCPNGIFCYTATGPPEDPFALWYSPFA